MVNGPHGPLLTFEYQGETVSFTVNDRAIIDATDRYDTAQYMRGGRPRWRLEDPPRVEAIILHHLGGWYGPLLRQDAPPAAELLLLDAMALDHRQRFGIGPAYHIVCFRSGRKWAVGKHGTHRAHTKGRNPRGRRRWNVVGRAVAAAGDLDVEPVGELLGAALRHAVAEIRTWPGVVPGAPVHEHALVPTVNRDGVRYSQATICPGRNLQAWRAGGGLRGDFEPAEDRYNSGLAAGRDQGWTAGWRAGWAAGRVDGFDLVQEMVGALPVEAPPPASPPTPPMVEVPR